MKEEFKYECPEKYLEDVYVKDTKEYCLVIEKDIFDDETIEYANKIGELYLEKKEEILNVMLDNGLRTFYEEYTDEYIKQNIGTPQIRIQFKKDESHPNWKFQYAGIIDFVESKLDEHIISIEFSDELELDDNVQING